MQTIGNKGVKEIADEVARVYVSILAAKKVTIDGKDKTEEQLMELYTDHLKKLMEPPVKQRGQKSGFLMFCEYHRPQLKKDGLDFKTCAVRLGELWNTADQDFWNQQKTGDGNRFVGKHCKFWLEADCIDDDRWVKAIVSNFNAEDKMHTIKYDADEGGWRGININEWIDDEYFEWISKEDYDADALDDDDEIDGDDDDEIDGDDGDEIDSDDGDEIDSDSALTEEIDSSPDEEELEEEE
jgi:hypothetical protein